MIEMRAAVLRQGGRATIIVIAAVAACALVGWLAWQGGGSGGGDAGQGTAADGASGGAPDAMTGAGASPGKELRAKAADGSPIELPPRDLRPPAVVAKSPMGVRVLQGIERLDVLLRSEKAEEEKGDEAEDAWEREWEQLTGRLASRVRASPELAYLMREQMDAAKDEAFAIRLARILRASADEGFLREMAARVTDAPEPLKRRTAMLVLETKDARLWYDPVTTAYKQDANAAVRDEAAFVLGRSLIDRKHIRVHTRLRDDIQSELRSKEPLARTRALRTLMADRHAGPRELDLVKSFLEDKDPGVRDAAARTVRVLEPRVKRLLERRK